MESSADKNIVEWDENDVQSWLASLGYPQYDSQIKEHNISGDVLCMLDNEGLKAVGVSTVGQRLAILKSVYLLKLAHNVPIDADHYIPPSEAQDRQEGITLDRLHITVRDQERRLAALEEENRRLNESLQLFLDDFNQLRSSHGQPDDSPLRRQPSFKWASYVKPAKSPTKPDIESPHPSPQQAEHDVPYNRHAQPQFAASSPDKQPTQRSTGESSNTPSKPPRQDSSDNLKSFKVSLDDPTWKVLPAALKKYRINNDSWQNYAMFICYGSNGNRIERCLSYDEKPLLLFQKLKDARKNPVFMLKHIKDIRSPIAVAQQKHAARKASSTIGPGDASTNQSRTTAAGRSNRPPKLEVSDFANAPMLSGSSAQAGWPEVMSPSSEQKDRVVDDASVNGTVRGHDSSMSGSTIVGGSADSTRSRAGDGGDAGSGSHARDNPVAMSGVSYAVAIYPYMAEQDDEFDVVVGDTFVILSRARGWWVVQRDPTGSGVVDTDTSKQGWVPAGCLLETNVPVASAIAEATAAKHSETGTPPQSPVSKTPILPLSIISTSFPGIALMDYKKKGDEELDLVKDDALRVFKRYNHWSYAVKEDGGDRGWVPSWFIGKVSNAPATPSVSAPQTTLNSSADDSTAQVSPMSSAFPAVHSKSTTAV